MFQPHPPTSPRRERVNRGCGAPTPAGSCRVLIGQSLGLVALMKYSPEQPGSLFWGLQRDAWGQRGAAGDRNSLVRSEAWGRSGGEGTHGPAELNLGTPPAGAGAARPGDGALALPAAAGMLLKSSAAAPCSRCVLSLHLPFAADFCAAGARLRCRELWSSPAWVCWRGLLPCANPRVLKVIGKQAVKWKPLSFFWKIFLKMLFIPSSCAAFFFFSHFFFFFKCACEPVCLR